MADTADGIDLMRRRMERAQRVPPAARRPAAPGSAAPVVTDAAAGETQTPDASAPPAQPPRRVPARRAAGGGNPEAASQRPRVGPDAPPVNLAIRVRRPLDEHLVDVIHDLRKAGVRSSKVELIEMLLWEMPADAAALRRRLAEFRQAAPRGGDGT